MYVEIQKPINNALKIKLTEILEKKPLAALKLSVDNKDIYICITYPYLLFTKLYFQVIFQQLMTQNLEHIFFSKPHHSCGERNKFILTLLYSLWVHDVNTAVWQLLVYISYTFCYI